MHRVVVSHQRPESACTISVSAHTSTEDVVDERVCAVHVCWPSVRHRVRRTGYVVAGGSSGPAV